MVVSFMVVLRRMSYLYLGQFGRTCSWTLYPIATAIQPYPFIPSTHHPSPGPGRSLSGYPADANILIGQVTMSNDSVA